MTTIKPLTNALNYLETHLTVPATIEQAAAAAGYSRYHFSRTFLARTGLTPTGYLRKRRLSEAARALVISSQRILDIALDYQCGQGIGAQLLAAAEAWSREHGATELRLDAWEVTQGPFGFYARQGYRTLRRVLVRELI